MAKGKFYAVYNGREGIQIYTDWDTVRSRGALTPFMCWHCWAFSVQSKSCCFRVSRSTETGRPRPLNGQSSPSAQQLSPEQRYVLAKVERGESVFFTGSAGTGKSVLLREIIRAKGGRPGKFLGITASTGIASVNIGGCTLHSWAGIGLGKEDKDALVGKIYGIAKKAPEETRKSKIIDRWRNVRTLIIDESACLFDKLEYVARKLRKNEMAFGGIQVIRFVMTLRISHCSQEDFVDMLNAMRFGKLNAQITVQFRKLSRAVHYDDGIEPTELYPTRNEVDSANTARLNKLDGNTKDYHAKDAPGRDEDGNPFPFDRVERALRDVVAPKKLPLKVGAQVMLVKNVIQGLLVNGSLGRVVGFFKPREAVAMDEQGEGEGSNRSAEQEKAQQEQREQKLKKILATNTVWPAVQFACGPLMLCVPLLFEVNNADGGIEAVREQVPLILAWALSIHKSQGQTLERVRVDLGRIFEKGQECAHIHES
ncbi:PIF1-like helicase-domain-containing protein [Dichomitus squalens]|nr:PIF1-like helicase-domain-containing protein [Dichomitus squalens]